MKKRYESDNPFDAQQADTAEPMHTLEEVDAALYGKPSLPIAGGQRAAPISLGSITPDKTQPRREVPQTVRRRAKEDGLPEWEMWHQIAERLAEHEINLPQLLRGEGEAADEEKTGLPLVDGFLALVALAASINRDGLANPILITARGTDRYMIVAGERRYQAYQLLYGVLEDEKFAKIPARVVPTADVWIQAAENGSRKPLYAIGMARQLALLIMELNKGRNGITYRPFEDFEDRCDREFYAQVADGNTHRIPKGTSERILQATGLKSKSQIAQYRALLDISDELWMQADEENWTENRIREHVLTIKNPDRFTDRKPMDETDAFGRPVQPPGIKKGEGAGTPATGEFQLLHGKELVEYVEATARKKELGGGLDVTIWHLDRNKTRTWSETVRHTDLFDLPHPDEGKNTGGFPSQQGTPFVAPKITYDAIGPNTATRLEVGQWRKQPSGRVIEILSILANEVSYAEISPATGRPMGRFVMSLPYAASLPIVSKDVLPTPQVPFEDDEAEEPTTKTPFSPHVYEQVFVHTPTGKFYRQMGEIRTDGRINGVEVDENGDSTHFQNYILTDFAEFTPYEKPSEAVDNPLSNSTRPPLPSWAVEGTIVETIASGSGAIHSVYWNDETRGWQAVVLTGRGEQKHHIAHLMPLNAPLDEDPVIDDAPDLPSWAVTGAMVQHIDTKEICNVLGTIWAPEDGLWFLRVMLRDGRDADAPARDFERYVHPGMDAKNLTRVITEAQFDFNAICNLAADYKMENETDLIRQARASTPSAIFTFLDKDGHEGTVARIEAQYEALVAAPKRSIAAADEWRFSALELARQKAAAKQGA